MLNHHELEDENFPAFVYNNIEYLEQGRWHTLEGEGSDAMLTIHCGDNATNWALPKPLPTETTLAELRWAHAANPGEEGPGRGELLLDTSHAAPPVYGVWCVCL